MTRVYGQPWNKGRSVGARRALSSTEIATVKTHLKQYSLHDLCLFMTAIDTMLRASDLLGLKVRDVMLTNGAIRQSFPLRQKKTQSAVFPVLTNGTQQILQSWIETSGKTDRDYIFTREKDTGDKPITVGFYRTLIKSWVNTSGIPAQDVSAHSLRRSKAVFLYERGVSVELIGRLLGHRSPASTIRYLGINESQAREAALLHNIFEPTPNGKRTVVAALTAKDRRMLVDQLWELLAPKLSQNLTENEE